MGDERPLRPVNPRPYGPVAAPGEFTFAVAGDGRPTVAGMPFPKVTADIMRELALLRPAFTLYTGDAIFGYKQTRQQMLNELDRFRALADSSRVPLFNVPGNHEAQSSRRGRRGAGGVGSRPVRLVRLPRLAFRRAQHRRAEPRGPRHGRAAGMAGARPARGRARKGHVRVHAPPAVLLVPGRLQPRRRAAPHEAVRRERGAGGVRRARPLLLRGGARRRALRDRGRSGRAAVHPAAGRRVLALRAGVVRLRGRRLQRRRAEPPRSQRAVRATTGSSRSRSPGSRTSPTATWWRAGCGCACRA